MIKAIIPYNQDAHYELLSPWFNHYWGATPPADMLPDDGYLIYSDSNGPVVAGFIYKTNSKLCWVEHVIGNPEADKEERKEGIHVLIDALTSRSKALGFRYAFTATTHQNMIGYYKEHGFVEDAKPLTHMVKVI